MQARTCCADRLDRSEIVEQIEVRSLTDEEEGECEDIAEESGLSQERLSHVISIVRDARNRINEWNPNMILALQF